MAAAMVAAMTVAAVEMVTATGNGESNGDGEGELGQIVAKRLPIVIDQFTLNVSV